MTTIIKAGGSSVATPERLVGGYVNGEHVTGIFPQLNEIRDRIIFITSAQGNTTDKIEGAIKKALLGERIPDVAEIFERSADFGLQYGLASQGIRHSIFADFERLQAKDSNAMKLASDPYYRALLHMAGERIAAIDCYEMLRQFGSNAILVDVLDDKFPLSVTGDPMNASIDFARSKRRTAETLRNTKGNIVIPGYGGMNMTKKRMSPLGRGGSDTAAFGYLYAADGDFIYILTDVPGIMAAPVTGAPTVNVLDIRHTKDAAALGAKLPSRRSVRGLELCYAEGRNPYVYITHAQNMHGPGTQITNETTNGSPVKLVGGRDVSMYILEGEISGVEDTLRLNGVEYSLNGTLDSAYLVVPTEFGHHAEGVLSEFVNNKTARGRQISVGPPASASHIGIVGGMQHTVGVSSRATSALAAQNINIGYNVDPGPMSAGYLIDPADRVAGIHTLYREFFR